MKNELIFSANGILSLQPSLFLQQPTLPLVSPLTREINVGQAKIVWSCVNMQARRDEGKDDKWRSNRVYLIRDKFFICLYHSLEWVDVVHFPMGWGWSYDCTTTSELKLNSSWTQWSYFMELFPVASTLQMLTAAPWNHRSEITNIQIKTRIGLQYIFPVGKKSELLTVDACIKYCTCLQSVSHFL